MHSTTRSMWLRVLIQRTVGVVMVGITFQARSLGCVMRTPMRLCINKHSINSLLSCNVWKIIVKRKVVIREA